MAGLGWNNPQTLTNPAVISPCSWSRWQFETGENSVESNNDHNDMVIKTDFAESFFNQSPLLQGIKVCETSLNSGRVSEMIKQSIPSLDSTNGTSNLNVSPWEDAKIFALDNTVKSEIDHAWGKALDAQQYCAFNMSHVVIPESGLMENFGTTDGLQVVDAIEAGKGQFSNSELNDTLNCLWLMMNSNGEDDGISVVCSDYKNFWGSSNCSVSSGESECNAASRGSKSNKEKNWQKNKQGDTSAAHPGSSNTRPSSKKRNEEEEPNTMATSHYWDLLHLNASTSEGGFQLIVDEPSKSKRPRPEKHHSPSTINFGQPSSSCSSFDKPDAEAISQMKEMIYRAAAFRPVNLGFEVVEKPKRKNVRISSDPQTVAARQRRERISERIRILQRLVPGGTKMDTASMLDEAANYLQFLKSQVLALEASGHHVDPTHCTASSLTFSPSFSHTIRMQSFYPYPKSS